MREVEAEMRKDDADTTVEVKGQGRRHSGVAKDADTRALERRVSDALGLEVSVDHRGEGGTLRIKYRNLDQLDAILRKLSA